MGLKEFSYIIDRHASKQKRMPVIALYEKERASLPKEVSLLLQEVSQQERSLLSALIEEELSYLKKEGKVLRDEKNIRLNSFRLRPSNSFLLIQKLAATRKLYYEKKQIACDFFTRLKIGYIVEQKEPTKFLVQAFLKNQNTQWSVKDCDLVLQGAPSIAIKGSILYLIDENVSFKDIHVFFENGERVLSQSEYVLWQKDIVDDESPPFVEYRTLKQVPLSIPDPHPILKLTDRTGAFANLFFDYGDGNVSSCFKNKAEEGFEKDLIEAGFQKKTVTGSSYYCPIDKVPTSLEFLLEIGWRVLDMNGNQLFCLTSIDAYLKVNDDRLVIDGIACFGNDEMPLSQIYEALKQKKSFVQSTTGKVCLLNYSKKLTPLVNLFSEIAFEQGQMKIKKNRIGLIEELENIVTIDDESIKELRCFAKDKEATNTLPGVAFQGSLRPYQQTGVNWLHFLYRQKLHGIMADDMGLGKTVQVLAFLSTLAPNVKCLIVVPTSLLFHWKSEIERFLPQMTYLVYHGKDREKESIALARYEIIITSYGTLRSDSKAFQNISFDCIFIDEAQAIKNEETKTFQAAAEIRASFRLSITGTPIENSLDELWSQFHFLQPDLLGSKNEFLKNSGNLALLRQKVAPFILRRKKQDVAKDLPEKVQQTILIEMNDSERLLYETFQTSLEKGLLKKVALDGLEKHRMEILEAILRLRQIACHPLLVPQILHEIEGLDATSSKCELVLEDVSTIISEGKKVVVFSQFAQMLALLAKKAKTRGWEPLVLDGQTRNREEIIYSFQNDPHFPLFLATLKTGGVGLNLTCADYILIYEPWWNIAAEIQAQDRAHRIGRTSTVFCRRYILKNSIEEKILDLQKQKQHLADSLLEDESSFLQKLDTEDLIQLLT